MNYENGHQLNGCSTDKVGVYPLTNLRREALRLVVCVKNKREFNLLLHELIFISKPLKRKMRCDAQKVITCPLLLLQQFIVN